MSLFEHLNVLVQCCDVTISLIYLLLVLPNLVLQLLYFSGLVINQTLLAVAYTLTAMQFQAQFIYSILCAIKLSPEVL
jgi:uncharacterized membrane protein YvlD (DUF360 family)